MTTLKPREELAEEEKQLIAQIEKKHSKSVDEIRFEGEKRMRDAIQLQELDRVPTTANTGIFAARYAGLTASATYYDHRAYFEACRKMLLDLEPDTGVVAMTNSGTVLELLVPKHQRWPGGDLPPDAPFGAISDLLRGMRGVMLDMYRCPDKLLVASDKVLDIRIANAASADPNWKGILPRGSGPLHRGSDGFMSRKQFEKFFWPGLKTAIYASIELGYTVFHFFEGVWDQRLEYLLEFPKGKVIFWCEKTDIFKAKEVIGDHMYIQGGVPPTLLEVGSLQEVEEHRRGS